MNKITTIVSKYSRLKNRVFEVLHVPEHKDSVSRFTDWFIIALITINTIIIIAETFEGISQDVLKMFHYFEFVSGIVFTIEYVLRLWTADKLLPYLPANKARFKYAISFMAIIDFLAILPLFMPLISSNVRSLRMFRLLRLLRLLKLNRYTTALATLGNVIRGKATQILSSMFVVFVLMVISSILMYTIEHEEQPEVFENAFTGFYWAIETLTTVSYGDIYPITPFGRVLGAIISLLGLSLVAVPTGILSAGFIEDMGRQKEMAKERKHFCPYCGKKLDE